MLRTTVCSDLATVLHHPTSPKILQRGGGGGGGDKHVEHLVSNSVIPGCVEIGGVRLVVPFNCNSTAWHQDLPVCIVRSTSSSAKPKHKQGGYERQGWEKRM